ncbi:MAG: hypothetical protein RRA94_11370, partial [Bacteroidota bacterium]|nr:hypothetical protein [Bacteroidota bacterium]
NKAVPSHLRARLDEDQRALFGQLVAQKNGSQIGRALGISAAEAARLRIGLCERLHGLPNVSAPGVDPTEVLAEAGLFRKRAS